MYFPYKHRVQLDKHDIDPNKKLFENSWAFPVKGGKSHITTHLIQACTKHFCNFLSVHRWFQGSGFHRSRCVECVKKQHTMWRRWSVSISLNCRLGWDISSPEWYGVLPAACIIHIDNYDNKDFLCSFTDRWWVAHQSIHIKCVPKLQVNCQIGCETEQCRKTEKHRIRCLN